MKVRRTAAATLLHFASRFPVVMLTGPRHAGKTTLVREIFDDRPFVSMEDPLERERAEGDPKTFLARFPDGAVIDEAPLAPAIVGPLLDRLDRKRRMGEFVITSTRWVGYLSPDVQSLSSRGALVQLLPLSLGEIGEGEKGPETVEEFLFRGGYPEVWSRTIEGGRFFGALLDDLVERDVRRMIAVREPATFLRFVKMCAARTGQILNLSSLGADCGISHVTAKQWLSVLLANGIVRTLPPYGAPSGRRLVKTEKILFLDTGFLCYLLGIRHADELTTHAMRGFVFESFVVGELAKQKLHAGLSPDLWFWRNHLGIEVDLLVATARGLQPIDVRAGATFADDWTRSVRCWSMTAGLRTRPPMIVYAGETSIERDRCRVLSWRRIAGLLGG